LASSRGDRNWWGSRIGDPQFDAGPANEDNLRQLLVESCRPELQQRDAHVTSALRRLRN